MAERNLSRDMDDGNARWIMEPGYVRRLRRMREVWAAFVFLARGGQFKVKLDFSDVDKRVLAPVSVSIRRDGQVIDVYREKGNALTASNQRLQRQGGVMLARPDDPEAFLVKWAPSSKKAADEIGR